MSFLTINHFFHFLILDIILSLLLLCFIIFIDKYFSEIKIQVKKRKGNIRKISLPC